MTDTTKHIDDGGPAMPFDEINVEGGHYEGRYEVARQHPGMSLRDWFAGQAMAGMLAHPSLLGDDGLAKDAYDVADAMLKERQKGEQE